MAAPRTSLFLALLSFALAVACDGSSDDSKDSGDASTGDAGSNGGASNEGGKPNGGGRSSAGGATTSGGRSSSGGRANSGGKSGSGGAPSNAGGDGNVAGAGNGGSGNGGSGNGGAGNGGAGNGDDPGPPPSTDCPYTADANGFFKLTSSKSDYWVRLPPGYDTENPTPERLLVGVHGCGDAALNFGTWALVPYEKRESQDYVAISIGGRDGTCWETGTDVPMVTEAIAHVRTCFFVHQKKVVLAGYSSGGMLAYKTGMEHAASFAGILVENSGLRAGVGNVDNALANVAWKINVAHTARLDDGNFLIADVRGDRDKMLAAGIPLVYREVAGGHSDTGGDWNDFLLPAMSDWVAP